MGETARLAVKEERAVEADSAGSSLARVGDAVERASRHLLSLQATEGYWLGELQADTTLESDYIFYLHILGRAAPDRIARLARYVRCRQLQDGGWNIYEGGPSELNATIKAYLALRLAGDPAQSPHLEAAARRVRQLGGVEAANSFVRFYLALGGLVSWDMLPVIPPELMLLPGWSWVNLYEMSSWTRGIVVPLTILYALRPKWRLPDGVDVRALFVDPSASKPAVQAGAGLSWRRFFLAVDGIMRIHEKSPVRPLRKRALRKATRWMLDHLERSEGLAAIYPAMMNCVFALLALGHGPEDPLTARQIQELARFEIAGPETIRLQPCLSPVWDTAIAVVGLREAGLARNHPALSRAAAWLLDNQILGGGDWQIKNRDAEPGGWAFEFRNDFYPDVDDTAFVLMALEGLCAAGNPRLEEGLQRGLAWLLSMQNRDGGWAAFDRDNDRHLLTQIPFADHNAMIDPSTADVTARVVECLARLGHPSSDPRIQRALRFLRADQTAEGAWYGRWGVNYVYGTGGVLRALGALGLARTDMSMRGAAWLESVQNADGGFGETCQSYDEPALKGKGPSTASQTAWGLIGLLAAYGPERESVGRAVRYLTGTQRPDGSWEENVFTGTGFPRVFYLKYHLYRDYFPLYALARYRALAGGESSTAHRWPQGGFAIQ